MLLFIFLIFSKKRELLLGIQFAFAVKEEIARFHNFCKFFCTFLSVSLKKCVCQYYLDLRCKKLTRDTGTFPRRRGDDEFESRLNTESKLRTLKIIPTAALTDARH